MTPYSLRDGYRRFDESPAARLLPYTQNKGTQTSMPCVGFEPTIPVFEWAETVHALVRARGHCDRERNQCEF
jgi:hypothetical protein